jgi:hypothetical protein
MTDLREQASPTDQTAPTAAAKVPARIGFTPSVDQIPARIGFTPSAVDDL